MRLLCLALLLILCCVISFAGTQVPNDPGEPGVITGTVIDSYSHPLPYARVYVREHNRPQIGAVRYATTGQNGEFRIVNLRPGDYDVVAVPSDSTSMLSRWRQRVYLPEDKPFGKVTIRVDSAKSRVKS
jgi:protocatechuate 3,4-dioxygenase beta subunit